MIAHMLRDEAGQGLGEYALILGFIAVLCVAAVMFIGSAVVSRLWDVGSSYP
jgi:Flp pilus assembly pilin Flp